MVSPETIRHLLWHAGLESHSAGSAPSISECTANRGQLERLDDAVADFVAAMQSLNLEFNGSVPSESGPHQDQVPRQVAYAVSEVSRMLHDRSGKEAADPHHAAWRVETAWNAVLAGDIDDIGQHLRDEAVARTN
jgi:hypothetical protein